MADRDYILANDFDNFLHDALDRVEQHSSVKGFYHQFEAIRQLMSMAQPWLPEAYFASRFVYGLRSDIQIYVTRSRPITVLDAFYLACISEHNFSLAFTLHNLDTDVDIISVESVGSGEAKLEVQESTLVEPQTDKKVVDAHPDVVREAIVDESHVVTKMAHEETIQNFIFEEDRVEQTTTLLNFVVEDEPAQFESHAFCNDVGHYCQCVFIVAKECLDQWVVTGTLVPNGLSERVSEAVLKVAAVTVEQNCMVIGSPTLFDVEKPVNPIHHAIVPRGSETMSIVVDILIGSPIASSQARVPVAEIFVEDSLYSGRVCIDNGHLDVGIKVVHGSMLSIPSIPSLWGSSDGIHILSDSDSIVHKCLYLNVVISIDELNVHPISSGTLFHIPAAILGKGGTVLNSSYAFSNIACSNQQPQVFQSGIDNAEVEGALSTMANIQENENSFHNVSSHVAIDDRMMVMSDFISLVVAKGRASSAACSRNSTLMPCLFR